MSNVFEDNPPSKEPVDRHQLHFSKAQSNEAYQLALHIKKRQEAMELVETLWSLITDNLDVVVKLPSTKNLINKVLELGKDVEQRCSANTLMCLILKADLKLPNMPLFVTVGNIDHNKETVTVLYTSIKQDD